MADMTFKTNLLPSMNGAASGSSQSIYSLGSSSQKWILNGMAGNPVEYIVGTQTASTNLWTGNTADSALYDGKMILYVLPKAGTSTAATLNLTLKGPSGTGTSTTGAKPIYRYGNTTGVTTHFPALSRILLIYDATNNRWNSSAYYNTDANVKSTAVTSATTNYIVGSPTSTTATGGLSKHASAVLYTTANSGTSGYTQLRLGNTTATSSAGGKEGQIRLYGTGATYYLDLKPGAISSSNKTITFPNKTGTVALTSDIPDVSGFITTDSDEKLKIGAVANNTTNSTYYPILATDSTTAATRYYDSTGIHYNNVNGSTTAVGKADLVLGNSTASGNANNKKGTISLYSSTSNYGYFTTADLTDQRTYTFPDKTGTVAFTSDITDEKLTIENVYDSTSTTYTYYPILARKGTTNGIRQIDETGFKINNKNGSADNAGYAELILGNATAEGTAGNKRGWISIYNRNDKYAVLSTASTLTANREVALPDKSGTIALTSDIPNIIRSTADPTNASSYPADTIWIKYGADPMATMADYIVETGTSDGVCFYRDSDNAWQSTTITNMWTYNIWASGRAECWGTGEYPLPITQTWGSLYESKKLYAKYPTELFADNTHVMCQITPAGSSAALLEVAAPDEIGETQQTPNFWIVRATALTSTYTYRVSFYARGVSSST